jgi:ribosomal protein S18 acetylase RimI-like enzyme
MPVETRAMRKEDLGRVAELSGQLGYPVSQDDLVDRFSRIVDAGHALLVAHDAGQVIGWIHVHPQLLLESEPHAEIAALVVDATSRRQGAGRALVAEGQRWSRQRGFGLLRVRSNIARHEAHHFYPSLGFTRIKTQHNYELRLDVGAVEDG